MSPRNVPVVPISTYRLQFSPRFRFVDATAIVPYLDALGIGHIYASPYLRARPGSEHGYDVVDPNSLNPEIGTNEEHAALIAAGQARGMGHLLDFVPNHMGIGRTNEWWYDVLAWGEGSPYANFFDIDWEPFNTAMRGKVLLPVLGDHYGDVLERGEVTLAFDAPHGELQVAYFDRRFPLSSQSYSEVLADASDASDGEVWSLRALAAEFRDADRTRALELKNELAGVAREPKVAQAIERAMERYRGADSALDRFDELLRRQNYRLAFWRVSFDEINYRRFFDINDLAGLRVEDAEVLAQTHRFVFELLGEGKLQGLRIDHVDGLYNPGGYCNFLQDRASALEQPLYLVVEKILARFETLRQSWEIAGTTGYEFANIVNGLFVEARAERAFDRIYQRFAGNELFFGDVAYEAKKLIMSTALASELRVLVTTLYRIAETDRRSNDFSYNVLYNALLEVVAAFPVYRTYVTSEALEDEDRRFIEWAVGLARRRSDLGDERVFTFIESVLTVGAPGITGARYSRDAVLRFAMKFQQYTSPVTAKAVEDTAFYRYVRLMSLNEVGGDPRRFGNSTSAFHRVNAERAERWPHSMIATATHDHKRGEDVRTRIDALTEMPGLWSRSIRRWHRLNARKKTLVDEAQSPVGNDEYAFYQTLVGTLPPTWLRGDDVSREDLEAYVARIDAYMLKCVREAKLHSSWTNPNAAYEAATSAFVRKTLDPVRNAPFWRELIEFGQEVATLGMLHSLSQVALKLMSPGVPDIYQGCELWDLSLVDPDNRRPVDYASRMAMLEDFRARDERGESAELVRELMATWHDGRIKAYLTWRLLHLRREHRETMLGGFYTPLDADGERADNIVAFTRGDIVVVATRLGRPLLTLEDGIPRLRFESERIMLPTGAPRSYRDIISGAAIGAAVDGETAFLPAQQTLDNLHVAVLLPSRP